MSVDKTLENTQGGVLFSGTGSRRVSNGMFILTKRIFIRNTDLVHCFTDNYLSHTTNDNLVNNMTGNTNTIC